MSGGISEDQKVSLRFKSRLRQPFELEGILAPLNSKNGVDFPYTPTIGIGHSANFGSYDTTHSIYQPQYYVNTQNPSISLTSTWTANSIDEAAYTAAALQFFKSCTKSEFGVSAGQRAGTPPPVLLLNAYGNLHIKDVPVVLATMNYNLTEDVDYVQVGDFSIPTSMLITLDLKIQQTPRNVRDNFDIKQYANGGLLNKGKGGFM